MNSRHAVIVFRYFPGIQTSTNAEKSKIERNDIMELIKIQKMGGIKCDNPSCTYRNESVAVDDYPDWLNRPCPLCGANLLTEKEFRAHRNVLKAVNLINWLGSRLPKSIQDRLESAEPANGTINFNGTGKLLINIEKEA